MRTLDVPYAMSEGQADKVFEIESVLTIEAGARLEFEANTGLLIRATGTLTTLGTTSSHVTLTGRSSTKGFWKGLAMTSLTNAMTLTDVTFAGNDDPFCCGFYEPTSGAPSARAGLVIGDNAVSGGLVATDVTVTSSAHRGVSRIKGSFTQAGTNDLTTGNVDANLL
jgi:hypothetical protein